MRKYLAILLAVLILCTGCASQSEEPEQTTTVPTETTMPPATTEETVPLPELETKIARVDNTPAVLQLRMRGDEVDVVGQYDEDHYVIKTEQGYGLVKQELLRLEGETPYEVWTAYAYYHAEVYDNLYLTGEPVKKLNTNTKMEVLDDLGWCYVVQLEDMTGFVKQERVSKWPFTSGGSSDDVGSGGGGGSTGADGGDISLAFRGGVVLLGAIEQSGDVTGKGTILADGTQVVLGYFDRGEGIPVVIEEGFAQSWEGYETVYLDGLYAYVPAELAAQEDAESYEPWDGYSTWNGVVYDNHHLLGEPAQRLHTNVQVLVLDELEGCYVVQVNDMVGCMAKDQVSTHRFQTGGGSSDDGGSGGGGGGGEEWSPPAM